MIEIKAFSPRISLIEFKTLKLSFVRPGNTRWRTTIPLTSLSLIKVLFGICFFISLMHAVTFSL